VNVCFCEQVKIVPLAVEEITDGIEEKSKK